MNASDALMVAAVVVPLTEVVKYSKHISDNKGVPVVMVLSAIGVLTWTASNPHEIAVANIWQLFSGWVSVVVSAAGVYGFIRESRANVMDAERGKRDRTGSFPTEN